MTCEDLPPCFKTGLAYVPDFGIVTRHLKRFCRYRATVHITRFRKRRAGSSKKRPYCPCRVALRAKHFQHSRGHPACCEFEGFARQLALAPGKVIIERPFRRAALFQDFVKTCRLVAVFPQQPRCRLDYARARARGLSAFTRHVPFPFPLTMVGRIDRSL